MNEVCLVLDGRVRAGNGSGETDVVPPCSAPVPELGPVKGSSVLPVRREDEGGWMRFEPEGDLKAGRGDGCWNYINSSTPQQASCS